MRIEANKRIVHLSESQTDVLELVCEGLSNREIRRRLHIANLTARQHVQAIIHKLYVRNHTVSVPKAIGTHLAGEAAFEDNANKKPLRKERLKELVAGGRFELPTFGL